MNRKHALTISLLLGAALAVGSFAAVKTTGSRSEAAAPLGYVSQRSAQLDAFERTLDAQAAALKKTAGQAPRTNVIRQQVVVSVPAGPEEGEPFDDGSEEDD